MAEVTTEKLLEDLRQVVRDAEELLRATAGMAGEKVTEVRARAEETLRAAKARILEVSSDLNARAQAAADSADRYVRSNPWTAIGIAAAAGLLLGALLTRRERDF
ncbi:MAG: DUF883 family protein [Pseudomonadota bacterium]|jgi:ElaB/YqjD/DUF883 family membrane-anchored ribosome-binding protein|nr:MAG: DUF883 domain-containing protein [Pseudomonadota bacterium]